MIRLPDGVNIDKLIDDLRTFSWEAADILIYYSEILKDPNNNSNIIKTKSDLSPVTVADIKVNETIISRINETYKDINWGILSEENINLDYKKDTRENHKNNDWTWILDPLDGTKDFIQGTGNYAMHLGLNHKNKPYLGVVLIPEKNELWLCNGETVWCEGRDGSKKKNNVFLKDKLSEMTIVISKNHRNHILNKLIEELDFKKKIEMGSIGCKIASIMRGESDIYLSLSLKGQNCPKDWDFAAPEALLKAAGGCISNLNNKALTYNNSCFEQRGLIIASNNAWFHKNICLKVNQIIKKNDNFQLIG